MNKTGIEWTDMTWNPVSGCTKVSPGCKNCYAEKIARRFAGSVAFPEGFKVTRHPERLEEPLRCRKHRRIFVNSMSDLFHPDVEEWMIDEVFAVMLACRLFENHRDHTFQILTKRPGRMLAYLSPKPGKLLERWAKAGDGWIQTDDEDVLFSEAVEWECAARWNPDRTAASFNTVPWSHPENLFPLSNVWLGVSVEDQQRADERVPYLLQTPAAVRFLSLEPLLGPVDLTALPWAAHKLDALGGHYGEPGVWAEPTSCKLDWLIVGAETGPGARPCKPEWAQAIIDQARAAGVPLFVKDNLRWPERIQEYPEVSRP